MMADAIGPLLHGAVATLALSLLGTILATIMGVAAAIAAQCGSILRWLITVYVSFIRGTPLLIQILIIYYILPAVGIDIPTFGAGVIALGVNGGAHIREIVRGALTAIPPGQIEAARALALPRRLIWTRIILPQVFALVLPPLTVEFSALLKGSALISVIGYVELTRQSQYLLASTAQPFIIWLLTALLYFAMCFALATVTDRIQRQNSRWSLA
jgi:His/Glu/Gln/Arg/opine family amino acid ABC transporter permease subunit